MAKKQKKAKKVSYHKQPEELNLREWQIKLRQQYGQKQEFSLKNEGDHRVWSDFIVSNPEGASSYRLALRGQEVGDNFCDCPDFKASGLGTCKHIEWALHKLANTYGNKQHFRKPPPERTYSSVYIHYGDERSLRIRIGSEHQTAYQALAADFFDQDGNFYPHAYLDFDTFLQKAKQISPDFRCYPDVYEWVIQKRADERRARRAQELSQQNDSLDGLINAKLYNYQREGVLFAFKAGRTLLADEMGLGKTIQALATAELYKKELHIESVYIICPTSLKYQWRAEIQKFCKNSVTVIEGNIKKRIEQYQNDPSFYKILTYNVVARDINYINDANPDLVILDEAQRIKNWNTKISKAVKKLQVPYKLALTGTPLENKLEDLYSIVQFLDQYLLGPLYLLLYKHQAKDEFGTVQGYRKLNEIYDKLRPVMIRRLKKNVIKELPPRVDKNLLVPMTPKQMEMHWSYESDVAQLVAKWRRLNFLSEKDRLRLMSCLQLMRMSCNSTYLVDQKYRNDTKIDELFYILQERLTNPDEHVVIFSQWSRMTNLIASELAEKEINFVHLNGAVPSTKRGELLDRFREDKDCRVFLSTDAGGLGLNLQKASLVINMDLPWNPAVLEQRIARAYRLGQTRGVQVINLISEGTIEHRMLAKLKFKSSLAEAVLDTAEESVFMSDKKFKDFIETIEKVTTEASPVYEEASSDDNLETAPSPASAPEASPWLGDDWWESEETSKKETEEKPQEPTLEQEPKPVEQSLASTSGNKQANSSSNAPKTSSATAGANLIQEGVSFFSRLSETLSDAQATEELVNSLVEEDKETGQSYLKIPVESNAVVQNAMKLLGGLLGKMG